MLDNEWLGGYFVSAGMVDIGCCRVATQAGTAIENKLNPCCTT